MYAYLTYHYCYIFLSVIKYNHAVENTLQHTRIFWMRSVVSVGISYAWHFSVTFRDKLKNIPSVIDDSSGISIALLNPPPHIHTLPPAIPHPSSFKLLNYFSKLLKFTEVKWQPPLRTLETWAYVWWISFLHGHWQ